MTTAIQQRGNDRRPLIIGLGLGVLAALLVIVYLNGQSSNKSDNLSLNTLQAVVATKDIAAGTRVTDDMLDLKSLPTTAIAPNAFKAKADVIGQTARYPIAAGEQITQARVVQPSATSGTKAHTLSFQIPAGMRAMTIPVTASNSPATLTAPGDFVDILLTADAASLLVRPPASTPSSSSTTQGVATILQNIQVLTVDRTFLAAGVPYDSSSRGDPPSDKDAVSFLTLAVRPDQAQVLLLAQEKGKLTLLLRPFGDENVSPVPTRLEPILTP